MDLIGKLEASRVATLEAFALGAEDMEKVYGPGKWTVRWILHHLADAETVLFDRVRRVISEPRPVIWAFDQDAWAEHLDYQTRPLAISRDLYNATREGVIHYARAHYEIDDLREFVHSETGVRTLRQELEKVALHNEAHLAQIRTAIGGTAHAARTSS